MSTLRASATLRAGAEPHARSILVTLRLLLVAAATVLALMGVALAVLFSQPWVHGAIAAAGGTQVAATPEQAYRLSDLTIHELLFGPGTFSFAGPSGAPMYDADEAAHMRDVRVVLYGFLALSVAAASFLAWALVSRRREAATWRAVARGGAALAVGLLAAGAFAAVAFGVAFELFHRLLFPGGNWAFDPATSSLVRLYPLGFWQLSGAAFGALGVAGGLAAWLIGRHRARSLAGRR